MDDLGGQGLGFYGWWGGEGTTYLHCDPESCGCEAEAGGGEEAGVGEVEG